MTRTVLGLLSLALVFYLCPAGLSGTARAQAIPNTADGWTAVYGNRTDAVWDGSDQGSSIRASNNTIYFVHGDTFTAAEILTGAANRGCYAGLSGAAFVNNSIVRLVNQNGVTMVAPVTASTEAIPRKADTATRFWAMDLFQANGNNIYVLLQALTDGLAPKGAYLQKFAINASGTLTRTGPPIPLPNAEVVQGSHEGTGFIQWSRAAINFFGAVIIYGEANKAANPSRHEAYVMQIPQANLDSLQSNNYAACQFWNASVGWLSGLANQAHATPILDQMIDSARIVNGQWLVSYKQGDGFANNDVTIRKGPDEHTFPTIHATYPGTAFPVLSSSHAAQKCGQPPAFRDLRYLTYAPIMHPEIDLANGRLLMSIAWNFADNTVFWQDAELYRLRFFDVPRP
jgi:hypothetical protein